MCPSRQIRLGYFLSHPIHYQAPLLRHIARDPGIDLTVLYSSHQSLGRYRSTGFDMELDWTDVDLISGYRHVLLPGIAMDAPVSDWLPFSYGLGRHIRRERFDAVWVHSLGRATSVSAIVAAYTQGVPVLVRDEANEISRVRGRVKHLVRTGGRRLVYGAVAGFLAIGTLNRRQYLSEGVEAHRIFHMPYAVDNQDWKQRIKAARSRLGHLRRELGLEAGRPVVLMVARLAEQKGHLRLFQAWRELTRTQCAPAPYLILVGDGPLRDQLKAAAHGLPHVRFAGFRTQSELAAFYALADILVLPSLWESWGLVVNEAMNAGCAIVASDRVGSAHDLVQEGVNGYRVKPDPGQLAGCLQRLLQDPVMRRDMGKASLAMVNNWSFDQDLSGLRAALSAALANRQASSVPAATVTPRA